MLIGPRSRLLLAISFSLGIHAGVVGLLTGTHKAASRKIPVPALIEKKPSEPSVTKKPDPPVRKIEPPKIETKNTPAIDKEQLLEQFQTEKKQLIQQTLKTLRQGEHIFLSSFLLKANSLDTNIHELNEGGSVLVDENNVRNKYDRWLIRVKRQTDKFDKPGEKIDEIHRLAHRSAMRGYLRSSSSLLEVVQDGTYNCASATAFIASIEDNLVDSKYYGVTLLDPPKDPSIGRFGHALSWYKEGQTLTQIENTNGGLPRKSPFTTGLRVPKSIFIAAYLVKNGVKPWKLPPDLARFYHRGADSDGFPIAGISTNKPDPPEDFLPNKYYVGDIEQSLKEAKIISIALSLPGKSASVPEGLSLSFMPYPANIDWCEIANDFHYLLTINGPVAQGRNDRFPKYQTEITYATAVTAAHILRESGVAGFDTCNPRKEFEEFKSYAENILNGKENKYYGNKFKKWMADPQKAKNLLFNIYRSDKVSRDRRLQVFVILSHFFPEDLEFFKNESLNNPDKAIKSYATFALRQAGNDKREEAIKVLHKMLEKNNDPYIKYAAMVAIAVLDEGMEAIIFFEQMQLSMKEKITLTARINRLHPEGLATQEEVIRLNKLIEKENNFTVKANLIAILAINGQVKQALSHIKRTILPLLIDKNLTELGKNKQSINTNPSIEAQEIVLALGRINAPEIIDMLFAIYNAHPELATEIADGLVRQRIYSEKIIKELKASLSEDSDDRGLLDNNGEQTWRRTHAALLLLLMEELKAPDSTPASTPPK